AWPGPPASTSTAPRAVPVAGGRRSTNRLTVPGTAPERSTGTTTRAQRKVERAAQRLKVSAPAGGAATDSAATVDSAAPAAIHRHPGARLKPRPPRAAPSAGGVVARTPTPRGRRGAPPGAGRSP